MMAPSGLVWFLRTRLNILLLLVAEVVAGITMLAAAVLEGM
jgi:hypothetical protein